MTCDYIVEATVGFSGYDYIIDDKPLLELISKAEQKDHDLHSNTVTSMDFSTAVISQPKTIERLAGEEKPDLIHGLTALYLCGHCGGYDGTLIGVHVNIYDSCVVWSNLGYSSDVIETYPKHEPFERIPSYSFKRDNYDAFLSHMRPYEIN